MADQGRIPLPNNRPGHFFGRPVGSIPKSSALVAGAALERRDFPFLPPPVQSLSSDSHRSERGQRDLEARRPPPSQTTPTEASASNMVEAMGVRRRVKGERAASGPSALPRLVQPCLSHPLARLPPESKEAPSGRPQVQPASAEPVPPPRGSHTSLNFRFPDAGGTPQPPPKLQRQQAEAPPQVPSRANVVDRRGRPPASPRWRLYCFRRVFVIEPNIPGCGLRYRREELERLTSVGEGPTAVSASQESPPPAPAACQPPANDAPIELPQLIIFRETNVIVEVSSGTHQLYKSFGPLQHLFLTDCLIGQLHIADARFLAVVAESEAVAGFCSASFEVPPRDARGRYGTRASTDSDIAQGNDFSHPGTPASSSFSSSADLDVYIYRIQRAWLIPFHLSLAELTLHAISYAVLPKGNAMGPYFDDSSLPSRRRQSRNHQIGRRRLSASPDVPARRRPLRMSAPCLENSAVEVDGYPEWENVEALAASSDSSVEETHRIGTIDSSNSRSHLGESHSSPVFRFEPAGREPIFGSSQPSRPAGSLSYGRTRSAENERTIPISVPKWTWNGFGDPVFCSLLGEKLAGYKQSIEKLLSTSFYYSYDYEITNTLQRKRQFSRSMKPEPWPCGFSLPDNQRRARSKPGCEARRVTPPKDGHSQTAPEPVPAAQGGLTNSDARCMRSLPNLCDRSDLLAGLLGPTIASGTDPGGPCTDGSQLSSSSDESSFSRQPPSSSQRAGVAYIDMADRRFVWNLELCHPFFAWSVDPRWMTPVMQGSVTSASLVNGIHGLDLVLISRRSCRRAGTRYNHRGLDDSGNVANFNESEQLVAPCRVNPSTNAIINRGPGIAGGGWASFVQIRGSVPLFWEQVSALSLSPTPQLTRELEFAWTAFCLHQRELNKLYGAVTYVNLLSGGKGGEPKLTSALSKMLKAFVSYEMSNGMRREACSEGAVPPEFSGLQEKKSVGSDGARSPLPSPPTVPCRHVHWDFHSQVKAAGFEPALTSFIRALSKHFQEYSYFCDRPVYADEGSCQYQSGVLRTNCLDCLDRTNAFQWFACWMWVSQYLSQRGLKSFLTGGWRLEETLRRRGGSAFLPLDSVAVERIGEMDRQRMSSSSRGEDVPDVPDGGLRSSFGKMTAEETVEGWGLGQEAPYSDFADRCRQAGRVSENDAVVIRSSPSRLSGFPPDSAAQRSRDYAKSLWVQCFGGDEGNAVIWYRLGRPSGGLVGRGSLGPIEGSVASGDYSPNILRDIVARMWADHGDHISKAYTGTSSVLSGLVRQGKSSLSTNMGHMMTSLGRLYQNTFEDATRQDAIELLLNQHHRLSQPYVTKIDLSPDSELAPSKATAPLPDSAPPDAPPPAEPLPQQPTAPRSARTGPQWVGRTTATGSLRVWFGTWNLSGRRVNEVLENWLMPDESKLPSADLYVVAIQELIELTGMRILLSQNDKDKEWQLELNIKHALGPSFHLLRSHSLVGLYMAVFIRAPVQPLISQVYVSELKLGFKGQMGNKGALLFRLLVGGTSFCFINVHLASGPEKVQQRRSQLQQIFDHSFQCRETHSVRDHDCVLIGGDFNFRCDVDMGRAEALLREGNWRDLFHRDQFVAFKRLAVPPFRELHEAEVHFLPTYKFRRGTNLYDKGRIPGWCDRIFYSGEFTKCAVTRHYITCPTYDRLDEFLSSDHKPVYAIFQVAVHLDLPPPRALPPAAIEASTTGLEGAPGQPTSTTPALRRRPGGSPLASSTLESSSGDSTVVSKSDSSGPQMGEAGSSLLREACSETASHPLAGRQRIPGWNSGLLDSQFTAPEANNKQPSFGDWGTDTHWVRFDTSTPASNPDLAGAASRAVLSSDLLD